MVGPATSTAGRAMTGLHLLPLWILLIALIVAILRHEMSL